MHITTNRAKSLRNVGPCTFHFEYEAANQTGIRASIITKITAQGTQKQAKDISLYSTMSMVK